MLHRGLSPDPCLRYEPNDTLSTAWGPLANGQAIEAALCNGDPDDYFYVDLASATTLVLDLTNLPSGTDYDLVLYNANGSELATARNYGTTAERITRGVSAGRYYVRVYPYSGRSSQAYRLTAAWGGPIQAEEPAPVDWGLPGNRCLRQTSLAARAVIGYNAVENSFQRGQPCLLV